MDENRLQELARRLAGPEWTDAHRLMTDPLVRRFATALGVDFGSLDEQFEDAARGLSTLLEAALLFAPHGWAVSARSLKTTDYEAAVALWNDSRDPLAVDELLARAWTDLVWLRHAYGPMTGLAGRHQPTQTLMRARSRLIDKAVTHHMNGDFEASTLIVLTQVDGLTFDFTEGEHGFFWRGQDRFFEDDHTLAGMPEFLRAVRATVNRDVNRTTLSAGFRRHAIMHGRDPSFGTIANSSKTFALLGAVIEWLGPKAAVLTERRQADHEARYAGTTERDADGRRLDRRGFVEARHVLRRVSIQQMAAFRDDGRYTATLRGKWQPPVTFAVSGDGRAYWAWARSGSDFCFGISGQNGEVLSSFYADDGPPGSPVTDPRWVRELDDLPPDWDV